MKLKKLPSIFPLSRFDFAKVTKKNEASADINIISCKTEVENKLSPISVLVMIQITTQIMAHFIHNYIVLPTGKIR